MSFVFAHLFVAFFSSYIILISNHVTQCLFDNRKRARIGRKWTIDFISGSGWGEGGEIKISFLLLKDKANIK